MSNASSIKPFNDRINDLNIKLLKSYQENLRLKAELEALRKDAAIGKLVRSKMISANDIPVSRCIITSDEIDEAIRKLKVGE